MESASTTVSDGTIRALRYTALTGNSTTPLQEEPEDLEEPQDLAAQRLRRAFSTRSAISTTPSVASRIQKAALRTEHDRENLRVIGLGSCGTVFEIPGTELACKKGTNERSIWSDFCLTNRVHNAVNHVSRIIQEAFPESTIPRTPLCHDYHAIDDETFWLANLQRFPSAYRNRQPLFTVDRILPLPQQTRTDLIEEYFNQDESIQQEAKDDEENKDCLVRIYLGERESVNQQSSGVYDTLRNFPLRLNMMQDLEIETSDLSTEMAIGLAIMHWQAQVDGMDVEFVLGSSATRDREQPQGYDDISAPPHIVSGMKLKRRAVHVWILDFDKARAIGSRKEDVDKKLVPAFLGNDPYYPKPHVDEELWDEFCNSYLKASELVLRGRGFDEQVMRLPRRFLDEVIRVSNEHKDWNEEKDIVFRE